MTKYYEVEVCDWADDQDTVATLFSNQEAACRYAKEMAQLGCRFQITGPYSVFDINGVNRAVEKTAKIFGITDLRKTT